MRSCSFAFTNQVTRLRSRNFRTKARIVTLLLSSVAILTFGGWVLELATQSSQSATAATMLVVPNGLEEVEGNYGADDPNLNDPFPNGFTNQALIPASHFDTLRGSPGVITGYRYRPDRSVRAPRTISYDRVIISMSTTDRSADDLSMTFAENVGADETVVYDGPWKFSTNNLGPPEGPKEFDAVTEFTTPFRYDPDRGNLLIEVRAYGVDGLIPPDGHVDTGLVTLFAEPVTARVASWRESGIIVHEFAIVPEPSTASLGGLSTIGLMSLLLWRRRG
jgi:hypothetical protein